MDELEKKRRERRRKRSSGSLARMDPSEGAENDGEAPGPAGDEEGAIDMHYLEAELRERLRTDPDLFDWLERASTDGVWFWDVERPENEWMSPGFKALFGYGDDEIPSTSEWWQANIHPDDLPIAFANFEKHCADESHPYDQVVRYRHKDGRTIWVRCRGYAFRDAAGTVRRMLGAHQDVTELMASREELAASKRALEARLGHTTTDLQDALNALGQVQDFSDRLLQAIKQPFVVLSPSSAILRCNAPFRETYDATTSAGMAIADVADGALAALAKLQAGRRTRMTLHDGRLLVASAHAVPSEREPAILIFIEDVTEREARR